MFYSQHVLTKKGPLAKIWLAAHMQGKLTKAMVFSTDVQKAVDTILTPDVPMALRLTSNLLLGVVRILHRKSKYLLQESSDALTRLKLTFRQPAEQRTTASYSAITLSRPLQLPDLADLPAREPRRAAFLAPDSDITIDSFAGGLAGGMLDAFAADLDPELDRDASFPLDTEPLLFTPSQRRSKTNTPSSVRVPTVPSVEQLRAASSPPPQPPVLDSPSLNLATPTRSVDAPSLPADTPTPVQPPAPDAQLPPPMPEPDAADLGDLAAPDNDDLLIPTDALAIPEDDPHPPAHQPPSALQSQPPSQTRPVRRKRRAAIHQTDEGPTELSAREFRECLMDTSDLIRRPRQRRRVTPSLRYEDLLARPAIAMPPQLQSLFADNFHIDNLVAASPISDADDDGERSARQRRETEKQDDAADATREKDDVSLRDDDGASQHLSAASVAMPETPPMERFEDERRDTLTPVAPPREVTADPGTVPMPGDMSLDAGPMSYDNSFEADPAPFAGRLGKLRLRTVADTAAQVDGADVENVTEATVSARTRKMQDVIVDALDNGEFDFSAALQGEQRRTAARCFYELLNLSGKKAVTLRQEEAFGNIWVKPVQPIFDSLNTA